jgi:FkbM family methyltransferase
MARCRRGDRKRSRANMPDAQLLSRFRTCLRYQQAKSWQKPLLAPRRFVTNQLRKRGLLTRTAGSLSTTATFHLPQFTIVEGELVSQEITSYGMFEPELTEAFLHLVQPGQVVLDIGMHLGYYTTLFAVLVGSKGQVHAFEPTPSTRELAQHNTALFPQVTVHPVAVWSSAGTLTLRDYGLRFMGFNTLVRPKLEEEPAPPKQIDVQTVTLDQFSASRDTAQKIALIKIDAESAERAIIAGAKQLIARDQPIISVEVGDRLESQESRLLNEDLVRLGYTPWEFNGGHFRQHEMRRAYAYGNLIFAPAGVLLSKLA